jgi:hypothetical protein
MLEEINEKKFKTMEKEKADALEVAKKKNEERKKKKSCAEINLFYFFSLFNQF